MKLSLTKVCSVVLVIVCECWPSSVALFLVRLFITSVVNKKNIFGSTTKRYLYYWTKQLVSQSVVVPEFWTIDIVAYSFVEFKSCAQTTLKKILMNCLPAVPSSGKPFSFHPVFFTPSLWGIMEPEPHQLITWTVPLVLYVDYALCWPRVSKTRFSHPCMNTFNSRQ